MPSTVFFDVNETLSDLAPLRMVFTNVGAAEQLSETWFAATLRDGFAHTLTTGSQPFLEVARQTLTGLLHQSASVSTSTPKSVESILQAFTGLGVHDDVPAGVRQLATAGHRLVTLSNGSVSNTEALLERAGVREYFDLLLSVDEAGAWKPARTAYQYGLDQAGVPAEDAALIAVHPWDLHGAKQLGLFTVFLNRSRGPWPASFARPDVTIASLENIILH
jgi:2-haloacid dehalogenase